MSVSKQEDVDWNNWIGKRVCVKGNMYGTLKYFGKTKFSYGLWCGIDLDYPIGKNNGAVSNVRYFFCKPKFGLFVSPSKVTKIKKTLLNKEKLEINMKNKTFKIQNSVEDLKVESVYDKCAKEARIISKQISSRLNFEKRSNARNSDVLDIDCGTGGKRFLGKRQHLPLKNKLQTFESTTKSPLNSLDEAPKCANIYNHEARKKFPKLDSKINYNLSIIHEVSENSFDEFQSDNEELKNNPNLSFTIKDSPGICNVTLNEFGSDLNKTKTFECLTVEENILNKTFTLAENVSTIQSFKESEKLANIDNRNVNSTMVLDKTIKMNKNSANHSIQNTYHASNLNSTFEIKNIDNAVQELPINRCGNTVDLKINKAVKPSNSGENKFVYSNPVKCGNLKKNDVCNLNDLKIRSKLSRNVDVFNKSGTLQYNEFLPDNKIESTFLEAETKSNNNCLLAKNLKSSIKSNYNLSETIKYPFFPNVLKKSIAPTSLQFKKNMCIKDNLNINKTSVVTNKNFDRESKNLPQSKFSCQDKPIRNVILSKKSNSKIPSIRISSKNESVTVSLKRHKLGTSKEMEKHINFQSEMSLKSSTVNKMGYANTASNFVNTLKDSTNLTEKYSGEMDNKSLKHPLGRSNFNNKKNIEDVKVSHLTSINPTDESNFIQKYSIISSKNYASLGAIKPRNSILSPKVVRINKENAYPAIAMTLNPPATVKKSFGTANDQITPKSSLFLQNCLSTKKEQNSNYLRQINKMLRRSLFGNNISGIKPPSTKVKKWN